jgi:tRNA threonylcarbamoyladenosine biosynthesis protein TsaB
MSTAPINPDERLILALDAAGGSCSVALGAVGPGGCRVLAARKIDMQHGHAATLVPMIEDVMAGAGADLATVAEIAVGIGPGGFTGLRIALATARGLGLALGKPVIGITSFQASVAALGTDRPAGDIAVFIDSRREEPYFARLSPDLQFRAEPRFMDLAEIGAALAEATPGLATGDGLHLWQQVLPAGCVAAPAAADATAILQLAADPAGRFARKAAPLYLRAPDVSQPKSA